MRLLVLMLALLALPQAASADVVLSLGGTYLAPNDDPNVGQTYSSDRFDGTDYFYNDQPNLFDLGRLAGGTFTATLRFPTDVPKNPASSATLGFYLFDPGTVSYTFTLFDRAGAVVHAGASGPDGTSGRGVVMDNFALLDGVQLVAEVDTSSSLTGLVTPLVLGGETDLYSGAGIDFASNDLNTLSGLAIPTDLASYQRFNGALFVASAIFATYSPDESQYSEVFSGVTYRVDTLSVTAVPEPSAAVLMLTGGLAALGLAAGRNRGKSAPR